MSSAVSASQGFFSDSLVFYPFALDMSLIRA
jgi:hypothetical protein